MSDILTGRSSRFLTWVGVAAFCSLVLPTISAGADTPVRPDEGKFIIMLQEAEIGTDTFTIKAGGEIESRTAISLGGQKVESHNITIVKDGHTESIFTEAGKYGKLQLNIKGAVGTLSVDDKSKPNQKLDPRVYPFGNFSPHLMTFLIAAYDLTKGGPQKFAMLVVDGVGPDGLPSLKFTVSALGAKPRKIGGKTVPISRFAVIIPGPIGNIDTEIDTDINGHILLWTVPGQKLIGVRDGYQDLLEPETPADPLLSKPTFAVTTDRKVMLAMRDGVHLATDIYRPVGEGKFPVILQRTPYGRGNAVEATSYAKRGYVFVAQDVRGRFDSEGDFHPFVMEAKDGYDAVEWCAVQSWSNGNVGMVGGSYLGFVQWAAAREGSTHLKCLVPIVSPPDPFFNIPYEFGEFLLAGNVWWANVVKDRTSITIAPPASVMKNLDGFKTLPLTGVDKAVLGRTIPFFQEWLQHSSNDAYYDQVNFGDRMKFMAPLPALHISGWFDGDGIGTKRNYASMVAAGQTNQKLVYGPWGHAVNTTTKIGALDFGPQSLRDLDTLYLRWFDHWLKGIDNGVDREPPVDAFVMGKNEWRTFSAWPPKESKAQRWYFHSGGKANLGTHDGILSRAPPGATEPADRYDYDPKDPFIPGGIKNYQKAMAAGQGEDATLAPADKRQDLLYYTTPKLTQDVIVAGPISLHIVAASSAKDTDWFAILEEVLPDGRVAGLCKGIVRARFRKSSSSPTLLMPGEVTEYDIDLWAVANTFRKGHQIQVLLTSSCFPNYARNLNTGGDIASDTNPTVAHQTIYHTAAKPSYLTLPVLPK